MKGKENQGMIFFLSILVAKILKHPFSHHVYFKENYKMGKKKKCMAFKRKDTTVTSPKVAQNFSLVNFK